MNLVLFTSTYPFDGGAEQTFLNPELDYLCQKFDRIVLVPKKIVGTCLPLPDGVSVDESYASLLEKANVLHLAGKLLSEKLLYREVASRPSLVLHPNALVRMVRFLSVAKLTFDWAMNWLEKNQSGRRTVFYTYWFDSSSLGLGLAKERYPHDVRLVSRVHGYDLYEAYYYNPPYWPFRRAALALLDALFPDSDAGLRYLNEKYPEYSRLYETGLLGVTDPGFRAAPSSDNGFRIVSCSLLVPVKRVPLLLDGFRCAAQMRPGQRFEWTHKGNGDDRAELQAQANRVLPSNARAFFPGYSDKAALMDFYRQSPVDAFVNVSASEGTPVSIMEAASCGIPVIATAVGGNTEIVSEKNGILLSPDPAAEEIAAAILRLLDDPKAASAKRDGSRAVWLERYSADVNFKHFAERLKAIGESA